MNRHCQMHLLVSAMFLTAAVIGWIESGIILPLIVFVPFAIGHLKLANDERR